MDVAELPSNVRRRVLIRAALADPPLAALHPLLQHRRQQWDQEIDIAEITRMPEQRQPLLRWRRVALLAAGGMLVSTALLRYGVRR